MSRLFRSKIVLGFAVALGFAVLAAGVQAEPVVTPVSDPEAELKGAVRYRNLGPASGLMGQPEIFIGTPPLTTAANRTEGQVTWGASKDVEFTYIRETGLLRTMVGGSNPSPVERNVGNFGDLNYLEITITKAPDSNAVNFNAVRLDGVLLGSFTGPNGTTRWKVTGEDLTSGFTITGTIQLASISGAQDNNYVQIDVGFVDSPDTEGPVVTSIAVTSLPVFLNGEATVLATVDDTDMGNNNIGAAEYCLNEVCFDDIWSSMHAKDDPLDFGPFDTPVKDVEIRFVATKIGNNRVCVRGTDVPGNVGDPECQTFLVTYQFDGFFRPIENELLNVVKAGQAVPAKWLLTDANGLPIWEPASFAGLYSYPVSCTDFSGDPVSAVGEDAPGSSGLQYNGDGYWQFNWKTPKEYVNTCRAMYVLFDSGAPSPLVKFQFKK